MIKKNGGKEKRVWSEQTYYDLFRFRMHLQASQHHHGDKDIPVFSTHSTPLFNHSKGYLDLTDNAPDAPEYNVVFIRKRRSTVHKHEGLFGGE
jgi:hypothetical protein